MLKYLLSALIIFISTFSLPAQNFLVAEALDNKSQKKYTAALTCYKKKDYQCAVEKLSPILLTYPQFFEGHKLISQTYLKMNMAQKSLDHLVLMDKLSEKPLPPVKMEISNLSEQLGDYPGAIAHLKLLLDSNSLNGQNKLMVLHRYEELCFRHHAYQNPVPIIPQMLDSLINTSDHEYLPAFNADASQLIYSKLYILNGVQQTEDLFISFRDSMGNFSAGIPLEGLNTHMNEGAHSLSQDGKIILFTSCHRPDSYGGCDLYISIKHEDKWTDAKNMGSGINSRYWDAQPCIANNNKTIIFSSNRPGGYGGSDLWRIDLIDNKIWSEPENLGPEINTSGNEESPFLHPDNYSLYFRSDGHIGMGNFDLFVSRQKSFNHWTQPINLGYPINTTANDGALFVSLDGEIAYYSTDAFSKGNNLDIVKFTLPDQAKPLAVTYLKVNVRDAITGLPIAAKVQLNPLDTSRNIISYNSDHKGGLIVPVGIGDYALNIENSGYLFHSEHIVVDSIRNTIQPYIFDVFLQKIPVKDSLAIASMKPIVLNNIFFESGSATLMPASEIEIEKLYQLLNEQKQIKIKIIGHTDNVGESSDNLILSESRAQAVYNRLFNKGINAARLEYEGRGESEPITSNDSEEGRKKNRRTEFIIID